MPWQARERKTSRRRRRSQSKAASHAVRLTRAALRLGAPVKIEPNRYAITIAGEHVGTVNSKTAALLRAFERNVDAFTCPRGMPKLDKFQLVRIGEDLGYSFEKLTRMTKAQILELLRREGLPDLTPKEDDA